MDFKKSVIQIAIIVIAITLGNIVSAKVDEIRANL